MRDLSKRGTGHAADVREEVRSSWDEERKQLKEGIETAQLHESSTVRFLVQDLFQKLANIVRILKQVGSPIFHLFRCD